MLVVDDNVDAAESLRQLLELHDCVAFAAFDGQSGLRAVKTLQPQVVIVDLHMSDLDGRELVARARQLPHGRQPTFICLSAAPREIEEPSCLEAGFDAYLEKPITLETLRALIASDRRPLGRV